MSFNAGAFNSKAYNSTSGGSTTPVSAFFVPRYNVGDINPVDTYTAFTGYYAREPGIDDVAAVSYRFDIAAALTLPYEITAGLVIKQDLDIRPALRVSTPFSMLLGDKVNYAFEVHSPLQTVVNASHSIVYDFTPDIVNAPFSMIYGLRVGTDFEVSYAIRESLNMAHEVPSGLVGTVNTAFEVSYSILNYTPVVGPSGGAGEVGGFKLVYNLEDISNLNVTSAIVMTHDGLAIKLLAGSLQQDEDGFNWQGRVSIADVSQYGRFAFNDDVTLEVYGETYNMMVQSKSLNRSSPAGARVELELLGVAARYDVPIAAPITQSFGAIDANTVVDQVLGTTVNWQLPTWTIPAHRLVADNVSPVELATKIIEAVGGRLEANPDGSLVARQLYPVAVAGYSSATPDHVYTENDSILEVTEGVRNNQIVNRLRIRDADSSAFADRIEFEADDDSGLRGDVHVFPSPYRDITLDHTGPANVLLVAQSPIDLIMQEEETIQIISGSGSTSKPIYSIVSVEWLENDLSGLTFSQGSTTVESTRLGSDPKDDHSLVKITYQTRAKHFRASSSIPVQAQLLVIDENA